MSAAPDVLHLLAHRAGVQARDDEDWWGSPIETGLAAVAAIRHPPAYREQAEHALDALERWRRTGAVRPISADCVALALAAEAAKALARRNGELTAAAVTAVDLMAGRTPEVVPELHIALACWALDDVVTDREEAPWPALRTRLEAGNAYGLDLALRLYGAAIAARNFDASGLVQNLLTQIPTSPGPTDAAVVLWLLEITVDRCARTLSEDESGLRALVGWRAEITDRLALELDDVAFASPSSDHFDPHESAAGATPVHVSSMEALLLDIALAPSRPESPWLTYPEATALLGQEARDARAETRTARRHTFWALTTAAMLAGAALGSVLVVTGTRHVIAVCWGLTIAFVALAVALRVARRAFDAASLIHTLGVATVTAALAAAVNAINHILTHRLFSDPAGLIGGAVLAVVATVGWAALTTTRSSD